MKQLSKECLLLVVGCILYAVSTVLIGPAQIIPGSVLGIAVICNTIWGVPVGVVNLLFNIPIMALCALRFGRKIVIYTILILLGTSGLIDLGMTLFPVLSLQDPWVLSVLGGWLMGVGAGLLMRAGGTMGGTTAVVRLLKGRFPGLNVGQALTLMDSVIVISGAILLHNPGTLLFSLIYTAVCAKTIDVVYGFHTNANSKPQIPGAVNTARFHTTDFKEENT